MSSEEPTTLKQALARAVRLRCPRCGEGRVFASFSREHAACDSCALPFEDRSGKTWAFMYVTTAAFVGPFALMVLVLRFSGVPTPGLSVVAAFIVLLFASLPVRKSCAIALDYLVEERDRASRAGL